MPERFGSFIRLDIERRPVEHGMSSIVGPIDTNEGAFSKRVSCRALEECVVNDGLVGDPCAVNPFLDFVSSRGGALHPVKDLQ